MAISGRERKILELLNARPDGMTVKAVAKELKVSERTIHRDLKTVMKILSDYNLELKKKSGVGLRLIGSDQDLRALRKAMTNVTIYELTPEERQSIIFLILLEMNEAIKLFTLAAELKVTEATISHDLDQLEGEIATFHLSLVRKRGYGVKIEGEEANKRAALSHLIAKHVDPFEFISRIKKNIQNKSQDQLSSISNRLLGLVDQENLEVIKKRVELAREELPYELADSALIGLVVHLALAVKRLQKGENIKFDQTYLKQMEETEEYRLAETMIRDLEEELSMNIPDDEIGYITMHLLGAKLRSDPTSMYRDSNEDILFYANELIRFVSGQLDTNLSGNTQLLNDLVTHLKPTVYRLKQHMTIKNPMLMEIKQDYDDLFGIVREACEKSFPNLEIPDDEIAYLVLHFAAALLNNEQNINLKTLVICSSGIGTAKMLSTKLMQRIPEIKQVDNRSIFDLKHLDLNAYDIIISTIPLNDVEHDYLLISPMLTKSEGHRIEKKIRQRKLSVRSGRIDKAWKGKEQVHADYLVQLEALQNYSQVILHVLQTFQVYHVRTAQTLESILRHACRMLEKAQIIRNPENVYTKLRNREQASGLGVPSTSFALYHTRSSDILKPSFTIHRLEESLQIRGMDGEMMRINSLILMLAPEMTYQEVLETMSFLSSMLVQDQDSVSLFESGDEAEIKQFLSVRFHQFLKEKNLV